MQLEEPLRTPTESRAPNTSLAAAKSQYEIISDKKFHWKKQISRQRRFIFGKLPSYEEVLRFPGNQLSNVLGGAKLSADYLGVSQLAEFNLVALAQ